MAAPGQHSESRLYFDDSLSGSGAEDLALTWLEDVASDASLDPQLLGEDDALPASESGMIDSVPSPARSLTVQTTLESTSASALSPVVLIRSGVAVAPNTATSEPQWHEPPARRPLPMAFFACVRRANELAIHWAAEKRYRCEALMARNRELYDAAGAAAETRKQHAAEVSSVVRQRLQDYASRAQQGAAEDRVNLARRALEAYPSAGHGEFSWHGESAHGELGHGGFSPNPSLTTSGLPWSIFQF